MATIAVLYTTAWDNWIVAMGTWDYDPKKVLAVIGYVPIEEYAFFVIQTVLTGLMCVFVLPWDMYVFHLRPASFLVRVLPLSLFFSMTAFGICMAVPKTSTFYLGALLAWTGPILALQWLLAGPFLWSLRKPILFVVMIPTAYLWFVDHTGIMNRVWTISKSGTTGIMVTAHLPLEEALFFFLVNCMIVFGILAIERSFAIMRIVHSRIGARGGRISVVGSNPKKSAENSFLEDWTIKDEIKCVVQCAFMHESQVDQQAVSDLIAVHKLICAHSKTFSMASKLYPQPLREDIVALYGFCRISDDVADIADENSDYEQMKIWANAVMVMIQDFIEACYLPFDANDQQDTLNRLISGICTGISNFERFPANSSDVESVFRLFSTRIPRSVPKKCIQELLDGFKWDMAKRQIDSDADLVKYSEHAASSIGEACLYLMILHDAESKLGACVETINNGHIKPSENVIQKARDMGVALQLANIARDLISDAEELHRSYVPLPWFSPNYFQKEAATATTATNYSDFKVGEPTKSEDVTLRLRKITGKSKTAPVALLNSAELSEKSNLEKLRDRFISHPDKNKTTLKHFSRKIVSMAQPYTISAVAGIESLPRTHRGAVKTALLMYMQIGEIILASEEYPRRAVVSTPVKLVILLKGLYF